MTSQKYWLLKSEPETYSIETLRQEGKTLWSGVRNYRARNYMRDEMQVGDLCLFYHSGKEKGVVGIARVASLPKPDETALDSKSEYFDSKSNRKNPTWFLVAIEYVKTLRRMVSLAEIKNDPHLHDMILLKLPRLSIQPVSQAHFAHIRTLGNR